MPTNLLRARDKPRPRAGTGETTSGHVRRITITAGRVSIRAELVDTPTATRVWTALPLFSRAETWGAAVHFETPVETGRDRTARILVAPGDICYWSEEDRVVIAFGRTPISKPGEIRLQRPSNVWAKALDDVGALSVVRPGEKVTIEVFAGRL